VRRIGRDAAPGEREQAIQSADVLSMDVAGLGRLAQRGLLADLSAHKALRAEIAGAWPAALSICRHRGALVALPRNLNVTALHCNRTIFQEAGIDPATCASWEGLTRALGRLKARRGGHPLWRLGYFHYPTLYWENFLWQHDAEVFAPGTARCVLGQPAAITAIQEAASVLHRVGKDHVRDLSVWPERFLGENQAGDIACFVGEPLFCQFLANAADEWMSLPLPTSGKPACSGAGFCVGVRHPARSEAEAMNLLKLICGPFGQDLLAIHNAAMPAQQESARRYFNVPARNDRSGFVASAPNARMAMPWVYHPAVDALLRNEMPRILQNPDGVAAGCRRVEQILNLMELDARTLWPQTADGTT
jgi:ABC-type glycerol-3-phosphate transport system substrate-binding protein